MENYSNYFDGTVILPLTKEPKVPLFIKDPFDHRHLIVGLSPEVRRLLKDIEEGAHKVLDNASVNNLTDEIFEID